ASQDGVFAQRFASTGAPLGSEFQVNSTTYSFQIQPDVAVGGNDNFVVVWSSYGIFAQRYDSSGAPAGSEFQVNAPTPFTAQQPSVAADAGANFVVVWQENNFVIRGQRFASSGGPLGSEFQVSVITSDPAIEFTEPVVGADGPGDFVVAWR